VRDHDGQVLAYVYFEDEPGAEPSLLSYPHFYPQARRLDGAANTIAFSMRYLVRRVAEVGDTVFREPTMIAEPLAAEDSLESEIGRNIPRLGRTGAAFRQTESGDGELSAENLSGLLRRVSKASIGEIDGLVSELQTLRKKLQTDADRIERDIAKHAELNQQVMQLTTIISDSVKKLPLASGI
jgi:hypothetical protein